MGISVKATLTCDRCGKTQETDIELELKTRWKAKINPSSLPATWKPVQDYGYGSLQPIKVECGSPDCKPRY